MPVYVFECQRCGSFDARRPAAEAGAAFACPTCGVSARRCFTPPGVVRTPAPLRVARDRADRSAHEPEVVGAPAGRTMPPMHRHAH